MEAAERSNPVARAQRIARVLLSLLILWHVSVVLLAPNSSLERLRAPDSWVSRYINTFAFGPYWSFFAPEPGPPPIYLEWELLDAGGEVQATGSFPERESPFFFRDRQSRRIAFTSFIIGDPTRIDRVMSSYLCRQNPGVRSVRVWRSTDPVPSMEEVAAGKKIPGDPKERVRQWMAHSYCQQG